MRIKRYFGFSLILFIMIFSMSFAYANEINDIDSNDLSTLSVSADSSIDEHLNDVSLNSVDTQASNEIKSDSNEGSSTSNADLKDDISDADKIESDEKITNNGKVPTLRASSDEEILCYDHEISGGSAQDVMHLIIQTSNEGGGTIYLNGGTYSGSTHAQVFENGQWRDIGRNEKVSIKNVKIVGGSRTNPNLRATFNSGTVYALNFNGASEGVYLENAGRWTSQYFADSGFDVYNVTFENLDANNRLVGFCSGSMTNVTIANCTSVQQFIGMEGSYWTGTPFPCINCTFINCHQTYPGDDGMRDGSGQFGAVFGIYMENTSFINTTSAQHGGALCIADESDWGCLNISSTLKNCSFINVTSRWFAIYIHGNFSTTETTITIPQLVEDCKFIDCRGTDEYSACIGLSHSNVIIRDSEFTNLTGGQGTAIMVGGLDPFHEAFAGRNTVANNVTIERCNFTNNLATRENQSACLSPTTYNQDGSIKHGDIWFYPTGDAGSIFVHGNDTKIIDCIFNNNTADDARGAAIYIVGHNTTVSGSEFYDHDSQNGTIYLVGDDCEIRNSYFHNNNATSTGACVTLKEIMQKSLIQLSITTPLQMALVYLL